MEIKRWLWGGKRSEKPSPGLACGLMGTSEFPTNNDEVLVYNCTCFDFFSAIRALEL